MKHQSPHDRLLMMAEVLFNERGFNATGVDLILQESGVAKSSLYHHFSSKDALIEAVLRLKSQRVLDWLAAGVAEKQKRNGGTAVAALFETLGDWFEEKDFHGCLFARAAAEFSDTKHPARKAAANHTRKLFVFLEELCRNEKADTAMAEHLLLLFEGASAVAAKTGADRAVAKHALKAAEKLVQK